MRKLCIALGIAAATLLGGCASPAGREAMVVPQPQAGAVPVPERMRGQVGLREVGGGSATNPLWISNIGSADFESALHASLRGAGLGAEDKQAGRFALAATLERVDQPMFGFDMTVTTTVRYDLIERATNKTVWSRTIARPHTATMGDAFFGPERLRIANEGSARANIQALVEELARSAP